MHNQVFISYRRAGGDALAYLLKERLHERMGYKVFLDVTSLQDSGTFDDKLLDAIDECDAFLLILSPGALDRCCNADDWVLKEISHAVSRKKRIIPVLASGFSWPEKLPAEINDIRRYNGVTVSFEYFDDFLRTLVNRLKDESLGGAVRENAGKRVLFWSDFDTKVLEKIIRNLALPDEYDTEILSEPIELLSTNLSQTECVILIDTDVTKLSNADPTIERINNTLKEYVDNGGKLIATHDVIYRRTRNVCLQEMLGYSANNFKRMDKAEYNKTDVCKELGLFADLPDRFELTDNEICWGDPPAPDADVYFESEDGKPLVFSREYGKGLCAWMNSGDYMQYPSRSIMSPEKSFILLLKNLILL